MSTKVALALIAVFATTAGCLSDSLTRGIAFSSESLGDDAYVVTLSVPGDNPYKYEAELVAKSTDLCGGPFAFVEKPYEPRQIACFDAYPCVVRTTLQAKVKCGAIS